MINARKAFIGICGLFVCMFSNAQKFSDHDYFRSPLEIPLYLSGNFGELRSTHFHAGLDFKTQAAVGKKIFTVADGYVSRIKVQTGGYGRAIYINHPNGLTTVYGHLLIYNDEIEKFVKNYQYRNQTHEFDLYLKKNQIQLAKGDVIGLSGNSGSSGGPHLHFEIRDAATQRPRNGLLYHFDVQDNIKPSIRGIAIYPENPTSLINGRNEKLILNTSGSFGNFALSSRAPVTVSGDIGFGIEAYDYLNGSSNRCGIYSIELFIDSVQVYLHEVREFGFNESGYIKSHVDYAERMTSGRKFQKMQVDPNNNLGFYKKTPSEGHYRLSPGLHHIQFNVKDSYHNLSTVSFQVNVLENIEKSITTQANNNELMLWNKENNFETENLRVHIPKGALFDDISFDYNLLDSITPYSALHQIHNKFTPLNRYMKIYIKCDLPADLQNKALIVRKNEDGSSSAVGGDYEFGYVQTSTKYFGNFFVDVDTVSPIIIPLNISENAQMKQQKSIRFKVNDDLSGVKTYNGFIDNQWVLFEYDPKNDLVQYFFDEERLESGKTHDLELFIMDEKDNIATYTVSFYY